MNTEPKRPMTPQDYKGMAGLMLLLTFVLFITSALSLNLGAMLGIGAGFVMGFIACAAGYRAEHGEWPMKAMRDKWK